MGERKSSTNDISSLMQTAIKNLKSKKYTEAESALKKILKIEPDNPNALHFFGLLCHQTGDNKRGLVLMAKSIELFPSNASFYCNFGPALLKEGKLSEAMTCYKKALDIDPDNSIAYNSLGNLYDTMGKHKRAIKCFKNAITLNPEYADVYSNLGKVFQEMNRTDDAIIAYDKAIRLKPSFVQAHWNKSLALLTKGDFQKGWEEFEWRLKKISFSYLKTTLPRPENQPHKNSTILMQTEQGIGDILQFIRFIPEYKKHISGKIILLCPPSIHSLINNTNNIDAVVPNKNYLKSYKYDAAIPLLSLPFVMKMTRGKIKMKSPYITPPTEHKNKWPKLLSQNKLKIGLAWAGSPTHLKDHERSIPLSEFTSIFKMPDVSIISLQIGEKSREINLINCSGKIINPADKIKNYADTASIIDNLDLVISVDTSVLHLAGAMGKKVWGLIPYSPDWRWGLSGSTSIWYPSMQLFRQNKKNIWKDPINEIVHELKKL